MSMQRLLFVFWTMTVPEGGPGGAAFTVSVASDAPVWCYVGANPEYSCSPQATAAARKTEQELLFAAIRPIDAKILARFEHEPVGS